MSFDEETLEKEFIKALKHHLKGWRDKVKTDFSKSNDSSRLRKDVDMAKKVLVENLTPIYLVFSSISPRDEAIARLSRAGWHFLIGETALNFATELLGLNLSSILDRPTVKSEIKKEIDGMMKDLKGSYAFKKMLS